MTWIRSGLALLGGLAVGALFGNACVLGGGDCECREPLPLVRGTFRVTDAASSSAQQGEVAPLQTASLTIADDEVVVEYTRDGAPVRAIYTVANKYDLAE